MAHLFASTCPFCGYHNELVSAMGRTASPGDGDFSLCFQCASVGIFDSGAPGNVRKPAEHEQAAILQSPMIQSAILYLRRHKRVHEA